MSDMSLVHHIVIFTHCRVVHSLANSRFYYRGHNPASLTPPPKKRSGTADDNPCSASTLEGSLTVQTACIYVHLHRPVEHLWHMHACMHAGHPCIAYVTCIHLTLPFSRTNSRLNISYTVCWTIGQLHEIGMMSVWGSFRYFIICIVKFSFYLRLWASSHASAQQQNWWRKKKCFHKAIRLATDTKWIMCSSRCELFIDFSIAKYETLQKLIIAMSILTSN